MSWCVDTTVPEVATRQACVSSTNRFPFFSSPLPSFSPLVPLPSRVQSRRYVCRDGSTQNNRATWCRVARTMVRSSRLTLHFYSRHHRAHHTFFFHTSTPTLRDDRIQHLKHTTLLVLCHSRKQVCVRAQLFANPSPGLRFSRVALEGYYWTPPPVNLAMCRCVCTA